MCRAGHSIERRRDGKDNVVELLRDVDGKLLAIAFPVWDAVSGEYIRKARILWSGLVCAVLCSSSVSPELFVFHHIAEHVPFWSSTSLDSVHCAGDVHRECCGDLGAPQT